MSLASDVIMAGLSGAIPAAASTNNGKLYFETDTNKLYRSNGSTWVQVAAGVGEIPAGSGWKYPADGRLTLATGTPVTTADQSAKTTLYYTPYVGDTIALYDGASTWNIRAFTELTVTNAGLDASKPYDVFCYDNSGTATLELLAWTNTTTRATALAYQNGVLVKSGATTRRYLGTLCTDSASKFEDSVLNRLVWNYYHRVGRKLYKAEGTSHSYNSATWRSWNNDATVRFAVVVGLVEEPITLKLAGYMMSNSGQYSGIGIGYDVTNASLDDSLCFFSYTSTLLRTGVSYDHLLGIGYHFYQGIEITGANNTLSNIWLQGLVRG